MDLAFLTPDWPVPSHVRAVCTTRAGGRSSPPYDSLNLGDHVGDVSSDVFANREIFLKSIGASPTFLRQVHTTEVVELVGDEPDGVIADGCVTSQRGVACTIMVADCLPVLFTNARGTVVGAAHAGWRGLAEGVLEATLARFESIAGKGEGPTLAWLGPCIGPEEFEVGEEVKAAFDAQNDKASLMFKPHGSGKPGEPGKPGKWLANLQGLARLRLQRMGLNEIYGNDGSTEWCTVANPSKFFSHRRDGVSGRFAAGIWLDGVAG